MHARITGFSALSLAVLTLPELASAQVTIGSTLALLGALFNYSIWLFVTVAVVVFFWGLIEYLFNMGEDAAKKGVSLMLWGIIAIFVMVSIWGIIALLQRTFGVGGQQSIVPSQVLVQTINNGPSGLSAIFPSLSPTP